MIIHKDSHTDHAITQAQWRYILDAVKNHTGFFIETIELPQDLGFVLNELYGPSAGDPPVPEAEVHYARRGERAWDSRLVKMPKRPTRFIRVIAGPHEGTCTLCEGKGQYSPMAKLENNYMPGDIIKCDRCVDGKRKYDCVLYTAYAVSSKDMPQSPKEPGDLLAQYNAIPKVFSPENDDKRAKLNDEIEKAQAFWAVHALATEAP